MGWKDEKVQPPTDEKLDRNIILISGRDGSRFEYEVSDGHKELVKQVSKIGEESKVALRNIRRDAIDKCKTATKKSEMTEDEQKDAEKKMQEMTDKYVKEIDGMTAKKSKELSEV